MRILAVLLLIGLMAGCGSEDSSDAGPRNAQSDLRPPVIAAVDHPDRPARLTIGNDSAPTDPIATDTSGVLLPPQDVKRLGWWADSSLPGSGAGTVLITGHIDDAKQGDGFAKKFSSLKPGDTVTLSGGNGQTWRYRIDSVDSVKKDGGLPVDRLNRQDGPETLALVTCGGEFIGPPRGYANNEVVFASRM